MVRTQHFYCQDLGLIKRCSRSKKKKKKNHFIPCLMLFLTLHRSGFWLIIFFLSKNFLFCFIQGRSTGNKLLFYFSEKVFMHHLFLFVSLMSQNSTVYSSIHLWKTDCLGCFQILVIMNKAAVNIHVQVLGVKIYFQFMWVNTKECNCWII